MPIAVFKSVREVSSEDAVHVAENLLKENAGKKWRIKSPGEKSAYVILEFEDPQQITGIDIGNEHAAFIEVLVSRTGCQTDDFRELLLSSSFMTPIESKNSSNQNRVRCFSGPALAESVLPEKWKLLKIVCTQPFNRHVQYGLSFVKVHVTAAPANAAPPKVKSLLPQGMMQFGAFKLREESPDSETDNQVNRFQRWKKETTTTTTQHQSTAAAIRDAGSTALRRISIGKVSSLAASPSASPKPSPKPSPSPSPVPNSLRSGSPPPPSDAKPLDRNRASLLFGDDDEDEAADEGNAKKQRLSKHLEADKDRRRLEQEKERESKKNKSSRHSLDKTTSREEKSSSKEHRSSSKEERSKTKDDKSSAKEDKPSKKEDRSLSKEEKSVKKEDISTSRHDTSKTKESARSSEDKSSSKHPDTSKAKESPRPSAQKRHSSPTAGAAATPAKKQKVKETPIQYRPFNQLLKGVLLVISGIQNPDRADLRSKAIALGAKYKADWEPGCTHLICAFKNTPKYNQVRGKGKIVTRSWIEKCYNLKKYLPWRRYALDTNDFGQPESDEELCDEAMKPSSRRESSENDVEMLEDIQVKTTYDADPVDGKKGDINQEASSGIDTEDELERVKQENNAKKTKLKTPPKTKSSDVYDVSTDEEDYLVLKKKQITSVD